MISKNIFTIFLAQILKKLEIYRQIQRGTVKTEWAIHKMNTADLHFMGDFQKYLKYQKIAQMTRKFELFSEAYCFCCVLKNLEYQKIAQITRKFELFSENKGF